MFKMILSALVALSFSAFAQEGAPPAGTPPAGEPPAMDGTAAPAPGHEHDKMAPGHEKKAKKAKKAKKGHE